MVEDCPLPIAVSCERDPPPPADIATCDAAYIRRGPASQRALGWACNSPIANSVSLGRRVIQNCVVQTIVTGKACIHATIRDVLTVNVILLQLRSVDPALL